jgi:hypothetical protein
MATVIDRLQAMALQPDWSRRRFLGQVVKTSAAIAAAAAGLSAQGTRALAYTWTCCNLEYPTWCSTASTHSCPGPCQPNQYTWDCVDSVSCALFACVECPGCACSFGYKICNCC